MEAPCPECGGREFHDDPREGTVVCCGCAAVVCSQYLVADFVPEDPGECSRSHAPTGDAGRRQRPRRGGDAPTVAAALGVSAYVVQSAAAASQALATSDVEVALNEALREMAALKDAADKRPDAKKAVQLPVGARGVRDMFYGIAGLAEAHALNVMEALGVLRVLLTHLTRKRVAGVTVESAEVRYLAAVSVCLSHPQAFVVEPRVLSLLSRLGKGSDPKAGKEKPLDLHEFYRVKSNMQNTLNEQRSIVGKSSSRGTSMDGWVFDLVRRSGDQTLEIYACLPSVLFATGGCVCELAFPRRRFHRHRVGQFVLAQTRKRVADGVHTWFSQLALRTPLDIAYQLFAFTLVILTFADPPRAPAATLGPEEDAWPKFESASEDFRAGILRHAREMRAAVEDWVRADPKVGLLKLDWLEPLLRRHTDP